MTMIPCVTRAVSSLLLGCALVAAQAAPAPQPVLDDPGGGAVTIQEFALPDGPTGAFAVEVAIDGEPVLLEFLPHDLRAPGFQLLVQGEDGIARPVPAPPPATVRGVVAGRAGSRVAGSLKDARLTAVIRLGDRLYEVRPADELLPDAAPTQHVVRALAPMPAMAALCATRTTGAPGIRGAGASGGAPADGGAPPQVAELAIDSDVEYFNSKGTVEAAQADIEMILHLVSDIFLRDAGVHHEITAIVIRTAEPDPYSSNDPSGALAEFATEWQTTQAGVPRDLAQFMTGKGWDGLFVGLAYQSGFCSPSSHYSTVRTNAAGNPEFRTKLSAHEMAHTWGAFHCNGQPDCDIMCSSIAACAGPGPGEFGGSAVAAIQAQAGSSPCMQDACGPFGYGLEAGNAGRLSAGGTGSIGTPVTFTYEDPPTAPSLAILAIASAMKDPSGAAGQFGTLLVDRNTILAFTPGVAFATLDDAPSEAIGIPGNPALIGLGFFFQAVYVDGLDVTGLSNGVALVVCG